MFRNILNKLLNFLERSVPLLAFSAAGLIGILLITSLILNRPSTPVEASVMITNPDQSSGGSGVVLYSGQFTSEILTNSHVCRLVEKGGLVSGQLGTYMVAKVKHNPNHDLCLITVNANLHRQTKVAATAPAAYEAEAKIAGHPALLPTVVTDGYFSGTRIIPVMAGVEKCTEKDMEGSNAFICAFFGVKPIIKEYSSTLATPTIMPGSSGSGVYNSFGELTGVVFAGSGNLGYAWTVPYSDVVWFLNNNQSLPSKDVGEIRLNPPADEAETLYEEFIKKARKTCMSLDVDEKLDSVCDMVFSDLVYRKGQR